MCVPCIIIASGCGVGNNAAASFINANEQFAEAFRYMVDNGTLSEADGKLAVEHCGRYDKIAADIDAFTKDTLGLIVTVAKRTPDPRHK